MNKKINFRTDLACESVLRFKDELSTISETCEKGKIKITKTFVDKNDEEKLSKKSGTYYAIELDDTNFHDMKSCQEIEIAVMEVLTELINN